MRLRSLSGMVNLLALITAVIVLNGCNAPARKQATGSAPAAPKGYPPGIFKDVTAEAGITFRMTNGESGKFYFVETTPGGCAFLDFNNDGWMDVFLVQSGPIPGSPPNTPRPPCELYQNLGDGTFKNVTKEAGLEFDQGYAQGAAVGDYNNDGYPDIYITGYDGCHLLENRLGDSARKNPAFFQDVTDRAGVGAKGQKRWATSAAFGDYDSDGYLDLVVLNYAPWTPETDKVCKDLKGRKSYCSPEVYGTEHPTLYRNNRDGTFTDVTKQAGLSKLQGRCLGVIWIDYDQDGRPDIYIANDIRPNMLLRNLGGGRFRDVGLDVGVAYGTDAKILSGMGIAVGDYENIGWESLVVTNFSGQPNSVYRAVGNGMYEDATYPSGVGEPSLPYLAFGVEFIDYDRDGWRDLVFGNGHVDPYVTDFAPNVTYKQPKMLMRNMGNGRFEKVTDQLGDMAAPRVTRGLAVGDFNNDGRMDVLACNHNDAAELFRNDSPDKNHFLMLRLEGVKTNRDAAGSRVWITAGGQRYYAESRLSTSYVASSDPRLFFGLGQSERVDTLEIRWPDGSKQRFSNLKADTFYYLKQGAAPVPDPRVKR